MILYKYVTSKTANLILKNPSLKFTKPTLLNDPFELTGLHYISNNTDNNQAMNFIAASQSYGVLSLTRDPLNPLMWAHYCKGTNHKLKGAIQLDIGNDSHAGMVFGFDTERAGLNDCGNNVIPAKFGNVIYTSTKPKHTYENSDSRSFFEGMEYQFNSKLLEALQRTFLYKPSCWSYEEEVRVVRNISRNNKEIQKIPSNSIREVYLGLRNAYKEDYLKRTKKKIKSLLPEAEIFVCNFNNSEWRLEKVSIDDAIQSCNRYS